MSADPAALLRAQTDRLVELGYPGLAGLDEAAFRDVVAPLEAALPAGLARDLPGTDVPGRMPFVLVVTRDLVRPEDTVQDAYQAMFDRLKQETSQAAPIAS